MGLGNLRSMLMDEPHNNQTIGDDIRASKGGGDTAYGVFWGRRQ